MTGARRAVRAVAACLLLACPIGCGTQDGDAVTASAPDRLALGPVQLTDRDLVQRLSYASGPAATLHPDPGTEEESVAEANGYLAAHLGPGSAYFVQISDPHIGGGVDGSAKGFDALFSAGTPVPRFQRVLSEIARLSPPPAFIIITGDLSDTGRREELLRCRDLLPSSGPPLYLLRGNHDRDLDAFMSVFGDRPYVDASRVAEAGFCYTFDALGAHFVVLDSETIAPGGTELQWLEGDLATHADQSCVVFSHRHLVPVDPILEAYLGVSQPHADVVLEALSRHRNAEWLFAGHIHLNSLIHRDGLHLATITSTFYDLNDGRTVAPGLASLFAHLVCLSDGQVQWVALKEFGESTRTILRAG